MIRTPLKTQLMLGLIHFSSLVTTFHRPVFLPHNLPTQSLSVVAVRLIRGPPTEEVPPQLDLRLWTTHGQIWRPMAPRQAQRPTPRKGGKVIPTPW
jgi:hypothetical protein